MGGLHSRLRISVVIPVRDDARMLERCLEALDQQRRVPDEIVVVDNGSADDSAAVAAAHSARVVEQPIAGIPRASATGYDAATGQIIARLDADSLPRPDWIDRIERAFREHPGLSFVTGDPAFYGSNPLVHWIARHLYIGGMYAVLTPVLGHAPLFGSNMAMRADAWRAVRDQVHREETNIHDDLDLSFQVRPEMEVQRDRALVVAVSARPFENWKALRRRLGWVIPTLRVNRQQETLRQRRRRRRSSR